MQIKTAVEGVGEGASWRREFLSIDGIDSKPPGNSAGLYCLVSSKNIIMNPGTSLAILCSSLAVDVQEAPGGKLVVVMWGRLFRNIPWKQ